MSNKSVVQAPGGKVLPAERKRSAVQLPTAIVVLGMHRSGTSALTRVLALSGYALPKTLMPPAPDNPTGFWESMPISELNDRMLRRIGARWDSPFAYAPDQSHDRQLLKFRSEALDLLRAEFPASESIVLKDPRINIIYDFWGSVLEEAGYDIAPIIAVRNPLDVAASLSKRNGFPTAKSFLLWTAYHLAAERWTRNQRRAFVLYADLLRDWNGCLDSIERALELRLERRGPDSSVLIDRFLQREFQHFNAPENSLKDDRKCPAWLEAAFEWHKAAAKHEAASTAQILSVAEEYGRQRQWIGPLLADAELRLEHEAAAAKSANIDLAREQDRSTKLSNDLANLQTTSRLELAHREEAQKALESKVCELSSELEAAKSALANLQTTSRLELAHREEAQKALDSKVSELSSELEATNTELVLVKATALKVVELETALAEAIGKAAELEITITETETALQTTRASAEKVLAQERQSAEQTRKALDSAHSEIANVRKSSSEAGRAVLQAAAQAADQRRREAAKNWELWSRTPAPRRRLAKLMRERPLYSVLRRIPFGRLAVLAASGLHAPSDGASLSKFKRYVSGASCESPHPLFNEEWYRQRNPDVLKAKALPIVHYLATGEREGRWPHPLFDLVWYNNTYASELREWHLSSLEHFILRGARRGFRPHPLFDTFYYVGQAPEISDTGMNPLVHYLETGWLKGLNPHPLFDNEWYLKKATDTVSANMPPLLHYVLHGWNQCRDTHPLFDTEFYLRNNADVLAMGECPLQHYLNQGWKEGRQPSQEFDPVKYLGANPDVDAAGIEPLTHYLTQGAWEHRQGTEAVDQTIIARMATDILRGRTPLEAQVRSAQTETENAVQTDDNPPPPTFGSNMRKRTVSCESSQDAALFRELRRSAKTHDSQSYNWQSYVGLSAAITSGEKHRIQNLALKPGTLVNIDEKKVEQSATTLSFREYDAVDVSIIVPVYNQSKMTVECLTSLAKAKTKLKFEVVVADDASNDDTQKILSGVRNIAYIRNERNLGFLLNVNRVISRCRGRYVVILNNDVQVQDGWLDPLVAALHDATVGAVAPKLLFPNGRLQEAGARIDGDGTSRMIGLFDDPTLPRYNYARDVDYVSGACIALRRVDLENLGGFDTRFAPAYYEDCDLCFRLRDMGMRIRYEPASEVYHHLSVSSNALPGEYKFRQIRRNQQKLIETWGDQIDKSNNVRIISFYLPQFHTIPENDRWWGAGFTEWKNVQRALPNYLGHYQPHRPAELGYYDLNNPDTMNRQAELAKDYGITGFCYYYYSFSGRRVLEKPLEQMLETGKPDLPFCICWANENWTRRWDGGDKAVLLSQTYTPEDDVVIIEDMIRYMKAENYIRVNGKPLLAVYRPQLLPNAKRTAETWRRVCRERGIGEIYLCMVEVFEHARTYPNPRDWGYDASIEFPPSGMSEPIKPPGELLNAEFKGTVSDYRRIVQNYLREPVPAYTRFRGVMPSWDNSARRQDDSFSFYEASPGAFQAWLEAVIEQTRDQNYGDERIVFVNAWNEWAEGAHLEPDEKFGRGWLEAVRNARLSNAEVSFRPTITW